MLARKEWTTRFTRVWLLLAVIGVLSSSQMHAQVYGSIYGTVLDHTGAVVPNASVVVQSQQKGTSFPAQTSAVGEYRIDHLIPDTYNVKISAPGFKPFTVSGLQVNAGETPKVDASLEVGQVSEAVTVNASGVKLLKTEQQDVTLSIAQETVQDLPIVGQEINSLLLLAPGAFAALG